MTDRHRSVRSLRLFALLMGAGWLTACPAVREKQAVKGGTVDPDIRSGSTLELLVVGEPLVTTAGASFVVPVRLRNVGRTPVALVFMSSCSFRIAIATADGREVARPEAFCLSVIREPTLAPGEVLEDSVAYTMGEPGVVRLEPGRYRITPELLSISEVSRSVRTARLDVRGPSLGGGDDEHAPGGIP